METAEELSQESIYQHAAKHGAILGTIHILLTVAFYLVSLSAMGSFKFILTVVAIYIAYTIYAGIDYRKSVGGYITFGKAYVHGIVLMATAAAFGLAFGLVLYNLIDTDLASKMTEAIMANTAETMRDWGAPEERVDAQMEKLRESLPDGFTPVGMLKNYFLGLIWYACFVLITSLAVRKSQPAVM